MINIDFIIGTLTGIISLSTGIVIGYSLCWYSFRSGAKLTDNIYHDKAPFDETLVNEPLPSHVDGVDMEEEE